MQDFAQDKMLKQISGIVQWICKTDPINLLILIEEFKLRLKEITLEINKLISSKLSSMLNSQNEQQYY